MKATEYLAKYTDPEDIITALFAEAEELAKTRNCHGGPGTDTTFGAYADCYKQVFQTWVAICRKNPDYYVERFIKRLQESWEPVFRMLAHKRVFRPWLGDRTF